MGRQFSILEFIIRLLAVDGRLLVFLRRSIILLMFLLAARFAGELTWGLVYSPEIASSHPGVSDNILQSPKPSPSAGRNQVALLFGQPATPSEKNTIKPVVETRSRDDLPETTLQLILKGVISSVSVDQSLAVISQRKSPAVEEVYGVGDELPGRAVIKEIYGDRVVLSRSGKLEILPFDEVDSTAGVISAVADTSGVVSQGDGTNWKVDRKYLNQQLQNISGLAREVSLNIHKEGRAQRGYRLVSPQGSPLLQKMGLQPGDILLEVNGTKLSNTYRGIAAFQALRNASEVRLVIERNGEQKNLVYGIQ